MTMRSKNLHGIALICLLILTALFGIWTVSAQEAEEVVPTLFIGTVTGIEDEFVGIALDGENVIIYICDGQPDEGTVSIAQWFIGTVAEDGVAITAANGNSVAATITEAGATGQFTFADGSTKDFVLTLAEDEAALYRSEFTAGDINFIGGWLVLADGSVRGAFVTIVDELVTLSPASLVSYKRPPEVR
jgi:hypothetical protein